ncbi:MAG: LysR family transcriptional regulator [Devosia sp.]|uniref:LysR family transcriptional regulator n=1 Tax=Devosia sp. TaxID=1871048 RepID=UPI001AC8A457|nr:LysR family transcriptional regulator [Devosia sp.]MBN9310060.1 LysR family transcriptional regulator [Devosia sp.]MBN9317589.1 LysR family transcriptional regulator [Devosia sp.]
MAELINLETFVTAVKSGSFAGAARLLGISPAMVGRRIQALEEHHGARLIERTTRAQRLTELGESFYAQAQAVLEAMSELDDLTRTEPGRLTGRIRATGPATLGIHRLAAIVARFCELNPAVTVELSLNDRRADLIAEGYDVAVRVGELQASSMIARRIGTYRFRCAAAPSYAASLGLPLTPEELRHHRCILNLNMSPRNRWPFIGPGGVSVVAEVEGGLQIDNGEAQLAAALAGAGIVYLPVDLVEAPLKTGELIEVLPHWNRMTLPIHIVHPSRRLVPRRLSAFMDAIAAGLKE